MKSARASYLFVFMILLAALTGCGERVGGLLTLKQLSDGQKRMAEEISAADRRFEKLVLAIHEGRLSTDNSKRSILRLYGEPVLSEARTIEGKDVEVWLYRYAKQFFGANKAYLYFDKAGKLARWEYVEAARGPVPVETMIP